MLLACVICRSSQSGAHVHALPCASLFCAFTRPAVFPKKKKKRTGPASLSTSWNQSCEWGLEKLPRIISSCALEQTKFPAIISGSLAAHCNRTKPATKLFRWFVLSTVCILLRNYPFQLLINISWNLQHKPCSIHTREHDPALITVFFLDKKHFEKCIFIFLFLALFKSATSVLRSEL